MGIVISGGQVYDPLNGELGVVRDIHIEGDIIVECCNDPKRVIDVRNKSVLPAGIDSCCHVAALGLNLTRYTYEFPLAREISALYKGAGYLHLNEPHMTLSTAGYVLRELSFLSNMGTSASLVLDLRDYWREIKKGFDEQTNKIFVALLQSTGARGFAVNQPSIEYDQWWYKPRNVRSEVLFRFFSMFNRSNNCRTIIEIPAGDFPLEAIGDPSGFHLNCREADWDDGLRDGRLMDLMERGLSVGISSDDIWSPIEVNIGKRNTSEGLCFGVGLVHPLSISSSRGSFETRAIKVLEFLLRVSPEVICFSPGSPDRKALAGHSKILAWLLRSNLRPVGKSGDFPPREYSISDLAMITSSNPAKILGLKNKGQLSKGALARIAIYDFNEKTPDTELEEKLHLCQYLIKGEDLLVNDFKVEEVDPHGSFSQMSMPQEAGGGSVPIR